MKDNSSKYVVVLVISFFFLNQVLVSSQLDYRFYDASCPNLTRIVRYGVWMAVSNDTRMAASLLRLHFHDCFVNGCDGSLLLDDTNTFKGEKNALPNVNSVRGYEVIDNIKAVLEKFCPSVVSCTDIVTLAAREAVYLAGGPFWQIPLGRRDGTTASESEANQLPSPVEPLEDIIAKFTSKGFNVKDVVALSGAHTFGFARCMMFKHRLFNFDGAGNPDPELDVMLRQNLQNNCPNQDDSNNKFAPLDAYTINRFDNVYYRNLVNKLGLLQSDQDLMKDNTTASLVVSYSRYPYMFYRDFGASMVKLANTGILTGQNGEIRKNCRVVN
ncbi:peroxidase 10 [Cucumis sativus]|uniref:Peroxidase n=1 Tax=Cucumis sativus TaxID=3659 RepID=A0A0A0KGB3_CUCSA|nr:peroxidase 10 [Cucumis sativus]KGN48508.1 hypothetical protein Csa_002979 [Cucumis sativus]